jgi:hypothetical protein
MENTRLCIIRCTDNNNYVIRAGIKATLIEANARLISEPQIVKTSRTYAGFLAVVIPQAIMNHHKATIPAEFDTIVRIGTEISFVTKIFAAKHETKDSNEDVNEEKNGEAKRPKLEE